MTQGLELTSVLQLGLLILLKPIKKESLLCQESFRIYIPTSIPSHVFFGNCIDSSRFLFLLLIIIIFILYFQGINACHASLTTRVQLPRSHVRVRCRIVSVIPGYPRVEMGGRGRRIRAASLGYTVTERQILSQTRWISENWVLRVVPCPLHMTACPQSCYRETSSHPTQHSTHIHTKQGILV